jgi:hypothetical protein
MSEPDDMAELDRMIDESRMKFQSLLQKKWALTGREPIEGAAYLPEDLLKTAEILPEREFILKRLTGLSKIMEVGTWAGTFAKEMLKVIAPDELHIVDIDFSRFDYAYFDPFLGSKVILHEGSSFEVLRQFDDNSFDLIYVDGDHSYTGASTDLANAYLKVKPGGFIGINDYTTWCASLAMEFGVMRAANELIISEKLPVKYFSFHHNGNHDIFVQKI